VPGVTCGESHRPSVGWRFARLVDRVGVKERGRTGYLKPDDFAVLPSFSVTGRTDRSTLAPRSRRPTRVQGRCSVPRRALLTGSSMGNGQAKRVQLSSPHWACWNGDKANPRTVYDQSLPGVTGLRLPRSLRRAAARRRPRQTSGAGNGRCTCRRFARIGQSSPELDAMTQDARFP